MVAQLPNGATGVRPLSCLIVRSNEVESTLHSSAQTENRKCRRQYEMRRRRRSAFPDPRFFGGIIVYRCSPTCKWKGDTTTIVVASMISVAESAREVLLEDETR